MPLPRSVRRLAGLLSAAILLAGVAVPPRAALAQASDCTLRIAMTLNDLPTASGGPDQGTEGLRFMGYTLYDSLVEWDLSRADKAAALRPGLATAWAVDAADRTRWVFTLREGVTFADGSAFDADAVVWNFDKVLNRASLQFDPGQSAQVAWRVPSVKAYSRIDATHVAVVTDGPDATLPYQMTGLLISSPARWREVGGKWPEFAKRPSGTGPWVLSEYVPRDHATMQRNPAYWDKARIPRCARLVLRPVPDPNTRTAALLSGQVDWIESPAPDSVPRLRSGGMQVLTGVMPHLWPYTLNRLPDSKLNDLRVRQALNLAIDREGLVQLLGGLAKPADGVVAPSSPWHGNPSFKVRYDPAEARRLLAAAGYGPQRPLALRFMISTSGSGQMYPQPMNELIQQNLADVGVTLTFEVLEWQALRTRRDSPGGASAPGNRGIDAVNSSWNSMDPISAFLRHVDSAAIPPAGLNWGHIKDAEFDSLARQARQEFDPAKQDAILARINERMVDEAVWLFVVHDVNPRAVSPRVTGVVEAQSWFVDFSPVGVQ